MSARYVLLLCLLCACPNSSPTGSFTDSSKSDAGQDKDSGGASSGDAGASSGDAGANTGGNAEPDNRSPEQIEQDARIERIIPERLTKCGLINRPQLPVGLEHVRDDHGRCFARCFVRQSCLDIFNILCGKGESRFLAQCIESCETNPQDGFLCKDGSRVPHIFLCDQTRDCPGGDDEGARCDSHKCANGKVLKNVGDLVCDMTADCTDGSDEIGCGYDCSTEPAPECYSTGAIRCDGSTDCSNGADETNCADVRCDRGITFVESMNVCDGQDDCLDGADEKNCTPLPPYYGK